MGIIEAGLFLIAGIIGFALGWAVFSGKHARVREELIRLEAREEALATRIDEQQALFEALQKQSKHEFQTLAAKLFEDQSAKFSSQSQKQIGDLLSPLRERITDFQKLVVDSFTTQGKEQHTLKSEIEKIVLQTDSLTKALRGDNKAQGNWGEVMLERILEESGLRAGKDYVLQGADMRLSGAEGNSLRPDVIVMLPEDKHIVIDSKVSLTAYERYSSEGAEVHLREFLRSLRAHVNGLEQKRYQDIEKLGTPDFVLMFLPIEGAYSLAVQADAELHSYAWGKKIVLVCPATLFATLRTIASLWRIDRQNKNAQEIARAAGGLYDKYTGFITDMNSLGVQLERSQKTYSEAMNKLSQGRGNLSSGFERLKVLGAKTSKSIELEFEEEQPEALTGT